PPYARSSSGSSPPSRMSSLKPWMPVSAVRNSWDTIDRNSVFVRSSLSRSALARCCAESDSSSLSCVSRTAVTSSTISSTCSGRRQPGHDLAVYVWPSSSEQHQETADSAPDCDGACHLDSQPRAARGLADQRLARCRHLFVHRRHPRSDGPAHQAAVRVQRHVVSGAVELGEPRIVRVP